jgi:hypothetical protein
VTVIARSPGRGDEAIQNPLRFNTYSLDCFASAFALRASADLKPAVARAAGEGGPLAMTVALARAMWRDAGHHDRPSAWPAKSFAIKRV